MRKPRETKKKLEKKNDTEGIAHKAIPQSTKLCIYFPRRLEFIY